MNQKIPLDGDGGQIGRYLRTALSLGYTNTNRAGETKGRRERE